MHGSLSVKSILVDPSSTPPSRWILGLSFPVVDVTMFTATRVVGNENNLTTFDWLIESEGEGGI